jgi:release factor glutamine methyltransferase
MNSMARKEEKEIWTLRKVLEWSREYLHSKEIDSAQTTAELLLAAALNCERVDLYLRYEQPLSSSELSEYKARLKRRIKHEPTQYILGEWEFWSLPLRVDSRVLIPRPETECLVEEIQCEIELGNIAEDGRFLDLCTGSGAIACALAKENPLAQIDATDICDMALEVARENVTALGLNAQIQLYQGDLYGSLPACGYDLIISNPPYIAASEYEKLQPEVRLFEPRIALVGGEDGLDIIKRILIDAKNWLQLGGFLAIEIGASQGQSAASAAQQTGLFEQIEVRKDYSRRDRVLFCRRPQQL